MAATAAQIARLRRMCNEPFESSSYTNDDLESLIESYPLPDTDGNDPDDVDWTATYDLHAAARDLWEEKAAIVAQDYNYSADGASFSRSEVYNQYQKMARYHNARRQPGSAKVIVSPDQPPQWQGNLSEEQYE